MTRRILENLSRQVQALKLLALLQEEEFAHLTEFRPQSVGALEFSIQELMRQLAAERMDMKAMMGGINPAAARLRDLAGHFGQDWEQISSTLDEMGRLEQYCAKQAEKSHMMAQALEQQTEGYLDFLKDQLTPAKQSYGPRGVFAKAKPAPAMMRGAL